MGAVFSEMDEEWSARRWFTKESIDKAIEDTGCRPPQPSYTGTAQEHVQKILELVVADNPINRRQRRNELGCRQDSRRCHQHLTHYQNSQVEALLGRYIWRGSSNPWCGGVGVLDVVKRVRSIQH